MSVVGAFIVPHPPIILPEVGQGLEEKIVQTRKAYQEVAKRIAELSPDLLVVTSPHLVMYSDYFHISPGKTAQGDMGQFKAKDVTMQVEYDQEFVHNLVCTASKNNVDAGILGEKDALLDHGTIIPLYFINQYLKDYKLVRIGLSGLPPLEHYRLGRCIAETAQALDRRVVFVASGDLSHKLKEDGPDGYTKEGVQYDGVITSAIQEGDFLSFLECPPLLCTVAVECGLKSFVVMAGALSGKALCSDLLSYEDTFGVGYAVGSFEVIGNDESRHFDKIYEKKQKEYVMEQKEKEDVYVRWARLALETYVKSGKYISLPEDLSLEMQSKQAGVFVSIEKYGKLRGCIGTIAAVGDCVAEEIRYNAISAGTIDPRFHPVIEEELEDLVYSVDILSEAEEIESIEELDVKTYGVIVNCGSKRGVMLPNIEGIDTPKKQIAIAKQKADIQENEKVTLERFAVVRHR